LLTVLLATRPQVNRLVTVNPRLANRAVNRAFLQPALGRSVAFICACGGYTWDDTAWIGGTASGIEYLIQICVCDCRLHVCLKAIQVAVQEQSLVNCKHTVTHG